MMHRQVFWHVFSGIQRSSGIQRMTASGNHLGGQWDVRGDDQVARSHVLGNSVISHVETSGHLEDLNSGRRWSAERLIGD
jgi:hypothetical protein